MEYRTIEEWCEILDSQRIPITAKNRIEGPYPYYGANGIQDYVNDYIFDDELVLLAEDGGNFGSKDRPIAYRVSGKCWVNNHAHVLKPKKGLDVDYLCYSLMFYNTNGLVNGATRQKLTQSTMRTMKIPCLEINEQQEIVQKIKKIESILNDLNGQLELLDELIKARFVEMFGDPVINSCQFSVQPMTDICDIIDGDRGKNYPKSDEILDDGYCLFLNAKNVTQKGFDFENCNFITREKDDALRNGKLSRGDVVLTTRGTVGNLAYYSKNVPYENIRINSGMVILRMNRSILNEIYFIELFKMKLSDIKEKIASGSAQPQLPISTMNKIILMIPPLELQNQFASFVQEIDKSRSRIQKSLEASQELFDSLMQEYFG